MKVKVVIAVLLTFILIFNQYSVTMAAPEINTEIGNEYKKVGETESLELYYSFTEHNIIVKDKRNGFLWKSYVDKNDYNIETANAFTKASMNSIFNFSYNDFRKDNKETIIYSNSEIQSPQIDSRIIKNGISIKYNLEKLKINLTIDIWLDEDSMCINVPVESIGEAGGYGLVNLELMPFFGAASEFDNGYMLYPDGSGALLRFKGESIRDIAKYKWYVYGTDEVDIDLYEKIDNQNQKQAMLPVFGVKKGDNGFLAIINEGEFDASINLSPSGYIVNLNRICTEFTYRRSFKDPRSDLKDARRMESDLLKINRSVTYLFLTEDESSYSGMANAYRSYLIENGGIKKRINESDKIPFGLDLFMGINEEKLLFDKYIKMTTFEQAEKILEDFSKSGIDNLQVNLEGWTKNGFGMYGEHFPPNRTLGGSSGLKHLVDYAEESGIALSLQDNFIDIYKNSAGFIKRYDKVYEIYNSSVTDRVKERYLFNPAVAFEKVSKVHLPQIEKYGIKGICFEQLGKLLYYDYNKRYPLFRQDTADYWCKILDESGKNLEFIGVKGGNAYVLPYANRLFDIPIKDTGYFITDETIPFYQMVVHGLIPYSSDPGNLFHDYSAQKLKWVEYGCIPYFELTYEDASNLRYTNYNRLFTSSYLDWIQIASGIYKEFNKRLGDTWSKFIIEHKKISEDIYSVTYEDGSVIYVNYKEQPVRINNHYIKALDYLVVDKRGNEQ